MIKLLMKKMFPERTVVFKGFYDDKQVEIGRIVYKAGGFDIKKRTINKKYYPYT